MQTRFTPRQLADPGVAASEPILRKCVHCGFCTATCPTYVLLGDELDSPRGRIYLIKEMLENDRPATPEVVKHLDRCLSCLGCMTTCPSGVHYQHLIDHARVHVERTFRRPWHDRALRALLAAMLPYPRRFRAALALAALARPVAPLLPARVRAMLELATVRARRGRAGDSALPAEEPAAAPRVRVALLTGCVQNVLDPAINAATIRLLRRAGAEVVEIPGCCGAVVHHLGREANATELAGVLIERLAVELDGGRGLDAIVSNASGCGTQAKDFGYLFRDHEALAAKAKAVSAKTRDVTELLLELGLPPLRDPPGITVAYHSACSMQHGQKVDAQPRALLARAGYVVREIAEGHLCCGSAGTYNVLQPEIAARLRERKLANIARTDAVVVATGNIGCITQLATAGDVAIVHTVELLDWATGGPVPAGLATGMAAGPAQRRANGRSNAKPGALGPRSD
jgi:glycolate oxidase iron-sulfur subunit